MVDTGATHNYLASRSRETWARAEKGVGRVKAINSAAQPIAGVAKSVLIKWVRSRARPTFLSW
ncbi:UNVERIFIED_CONTAM: hypothetical protein Sradi_3241500 [Sesamum radiatum]|uniref:Uncharacterized protein n=1 Tax=Sesamum radiatum TaxID=300843 RepID=A0AAW2QZI1_SESRA